MDGSNSEIETLQKTIDQMTNQINVLNTKVIYQKQKLDLFESIEKNLPIQYDDLFKRISIELKSEYTRREKEAVARLTEEKERIKSQLDELRESKLQSDETIKSNNHLKAKLAQISEAYNDLDNEN